jgi:hypothetical protein
MSYALAEIDQRVGEVEREIASIAPLVRERQRLLRARALILGEPEPPPLETTTRPRVTRDSVFDYLTRHPGAPAGQIAEDLGTGQGAISAHLYRGKGRLFSSRGGRWFPIPAADPAAA